MNLYRSVRSRDLLTIFFVSAVTSLLLIRFYLHIAGYPQVGGGNFHIAHMLWGGLFMLAGTSILLGFIGKTSQQLAAVISGAGFGIFIDEIGKFITKDNNYFFKPSVGIIYAVFVLLFFAFSSISRRTKLTDREYQLNALIELEEAVAHDMDETEKQRVRQLLQNADQKSAITRSLLKLLDDVRPVPKPSGRKVSMFFSKLDKLYSNFWDRRHSNQLVNIFFIGQAIAFLLATLALQFASLDEAFELFKGQITYGEWLVVGESLSAALALGIVVKSALVLRTSRLESFELLKRAMLINIFLTEFFSFSRLQFEALPGFALNLILVIFVGYLIHQEKRLSS